MLRKLVCPLSADDMSFTTVLDSAIKRLSLTFDVPVCAH